MSNVLIIKTSSLGDILQTFCVLDALKGHEVDWAVEPAFDSLVKAHPNINQTIPIARNLHSIKLLRQKKYDVVFDLQGNCKSAVVTMLARAKDKVGYGFRSVREWPNVMATNIRYEVNKKQNIRKFYLEPIERYFQKQFQAQEEVHLHLTEEERRHTEQIIRDIQEKKVMVCPGSRWDNKRLRLETWIEFLKKIQAVIFLMWGNTEEKILCEQIASQLKKAVLVSRLTIPAWQDLMRKMDAVIALDSAALHLCATTKTPSFSVFGPTLAKCFKPLGENHFTIQGSCPYQKDFDKQCPLLRHCSTGSCIKAISPEELYKSFQNQISFL